MQTYRECGERARETTAGKRSPLSTNGEHGGFSLCSFCFVYVLKFSKQKIARERKNKEQTRNRANNCSENNHNFSWNKTPRHCTQTETAGVLSGCQSVSRSVTQPVFTVGRKRLEPPLAVKGKGVDTGLPCPQAADDDSQLRGMLLLRVSLPGRF